MPDSSKKLKMYECQALSNIVLVSVLFFWLKMKANK